MKLWVDDIRDAPDESWIVARKVEQAIRLIATQTFETISIDHDIENRPDDETFKPVAYFIGEKYKGLQELSDFRTGFGTKIKVVPTIIIHSINPTGAKEIAAILHDYGIDSTIVPYKIEEFNAKFGL